MIDDFRVMIDAAMFSNPSWPILDDIRSSTWVCMTLHVLKRVYWQKWDSSGKRYIIGNGNSLLFLC